MRMIRGCSREQRDLAGKMTDLLMLADDSGEPAEVVERPSLEVGGLSLGILKYGHCVRPVSSFRSDYVIPERRDC